jgi:hypothetical protein
MKCLIRIAVLAAAAVSIVAAPNGVWAGKRGGGHASGAHSSGAGGGFHHSAGGFFIGAPFGYQYYPYYPYYHYAPPPYYYGPDYSKPQYDLPAVYVEKFEGAPTPETQGDIFCPDRGAYYPEVQDCPAGWQREFRASAD